MSNNWNFHICEKLQSEFSRYSIYELRLARGEFGYDVTLLGANSSLRVSSGQGNLRRLAQSIFKHMRTKIVNFAEIAGNEFSL
jgi:hypothetical protein